ncbi:MAG: methylmalonyl Co-A mutase-associated GTPase MeaB [Acidimicrobiales bacterium]
MAGAPEAVDAGALADGIEAGDRRALARGITLVESTRPDHQDAATALLERLLPRTGGSSRIGISGPPGVGKSTFIEAFGLHLTGSGHQVAVLAVDPTSSVSGGSILGDKTRMAELGRHPSAFIRPSPGGGQLGGVARRTREALLLCEAFGFDVVVVETIGVGQSEVAVADLVDLFLLLVSPGGGDELQGIKRGIMELADLIVVNKADGDLEAAAGRTRADYGNAVHLLRPRWRSWAPRALACSALEQRGIAEVWEAIEEFLATVRIDGELDAHRSRQAVAWLWSEVNDDLVADLRSDPEVRARLDELEPAVAAGRTTPGAAARELLRAYRRR